ncbi:ATPase family associated with various cellular activities (AAA) [Ruminococcaceae bacterium YRB3002]|nr:ATPase family associated with various cellular activities (AAA) [Ruminococcaceae bacterium YRB3002]
MADDDLFFNMDDDDDELLASCLREEAEKAKKESEMRRYREITKGTDVTPEELYTYYHARKRRSKYKKLTEQQLYKRIKTMCRENNIPEELDIYIVSALMEIFRKDTVRPILLIGNPGCGKTYLAKVVADVAGLGFHQISAPGAGVGRGLTGDSKTYRSSKYGELVSAIVNTESRNPVVLIDEIDKDSRKRENDHSITNELLSALDGSRRVYDNFLQEMVDTSGIIFILTANSEELIPEWLIDRCCKIFFPVPTKDRIVSIVRRYIAGVIDTGKCDGRVSIPDEVMDYLVNSLYDKGVRSIRQYQSLAETACDIAYCTMMDAEQSHIVVTEAMIDDARKEFMKHRHRGIGFAS